MEPFAYCIQLLGDFLSGRLSIEDFEREYLATFKILPLTPPADISPDPYSQLARAFYALESYDSSVTLATEGPFDLTYDSMIRELQIAGNEIQEADAQSLHEP